MYIYILYTFYIFGRIVKIVSEIESDGGLVPTYITTV